MNFTKYLRILSYRTPPVVTFLIRFQLDYPLLFPRFPLLTLSMYLFAGKGIEETLLFFESLKYLTQQTNIQNQQQKSCNKV